MSHISSFPAQESHYSCKDNHECKYLSENLNIKRMWHLYLQKNEPKQIERIEEKLPFSGRVKESAYRNIFNTCFNIGFGCPRSGMCSTCDSLNVKIKVAANKEEIGP